MRGPRTVLLSTLFLSASHCLARDNTAQHPRFAPIRRHNPSYRTRIGALTSRIQLMYRLLSPKPLMNQVAATSEQAISRAAGQVYCNEMLFSCRYLVEDSC